MNSTLYDVAIAGAGPVGALTALMLAQRDLQVVLLDAAPALSRAAPTGDYDLRVVALAPGSQAMFAAAGAWPKELQQRAQAYTGMQVWDTSGPGRIEFSSEELALPALGHIVEVPMLQWALDQALAEQVAAGRVARLQGQAYSQHEFCAEGVLIPVAGSQPLKARMLLGADGRASKLRKRAGIELELRDYQQQGLVAVLQPEEPHQNIARQAFTDIGPLGLLPLANGQLSIVWSVPNTELGTLLADTPEVFCHKLAQACGQSGFELVSQRASFPLVMQHAQPYAEGNIALLGDAAHALHPLAGLGMNLGIEDITALLDALQRWRPGQSPDGALSQYARMRRRAVLPAIATMDALNALFGSHSGEVVQLRDWGLNLVDRQQRIKREFMRYALGSVAA